ncbi:MAG: hypothetical protein ACK5N9_21105 [Pirellula sp.]
MEKTPVLRTNLTRFSVALAEASIEIDFSYRTKKTDANAMDAIVKKTDTFNRSFEAKELTDVADDLGLTKASNEKINATFAQHSGKKRFTGNHTIHSKPIMGFPVKLCMIDSPTTVDRDIRASAGLLL